MVDTGVSRSLTLANCGTESCSLNGDDSPFNTGSWFPPYTALLTTTFTFGEILDFAVFLSGGSQLWNLNNGGYDGQSSFMDLSNTAVMEAIVVKDSGGTVVPSFGLSTDSGAPIFDNLAPAVVPVPAAVWLFGSALGLLGWMRRKKA
jgi:hypothetical protein